MHFFSPANVMRLLEIVRGAKTADDVLATVMGLAKKIGKVGVVAGVCHGFIGNRMLTARQGPAQELLLAGAAPEQIDDVFTTFGFPMGPFQMGDLAGMDVGWHRDLSRKPESIREAMCVAGRMGQKNGKGFYDYDEKRNRTPSAEANRIIEEFRAAQGIKTRAVTDQEIVERCLYPMVNEGHKILEEGMAQRASDIDVVWIFGYGWPLYRGGPMFWGDLEGPAKIVEALERHGIAVAPSLKAKAG
jgi:3-hydroxyacyl-CoA dehydrogenase